MAWLSPGEGLLASHAEQPPGRLQMAAAGCLTAHPHPCACATTLPPLQPASAPYDPRFPGQNQARHCFVRYNEYYKWVVAPGSCWRVHNVQHVAGQLAPAASPWLPPHGRPPRARRHS